MKNPKLRFPEFTDDWEQRKLSSILTRRIEYKRQSKDYPRLAFASRQGVIPLSERKTNNREQLTKDEFTKKYLVTELDDIVYNPGNLKYGAIDRNKCQRGLISPIYVTFTVNEIPGFIERIVTSHNFQQRALRFEEGTVVKRQSVNPEDLITLDIFVASQKEEQTKISECFDILDTLIQSAEEELEGYRELKHGMLQKMFPQKGEKVPEVRFPEFAGDWEQYKLNEIIEGVSKKNTDGLYTQDDILACSLGTELDRKTVFYGLRSTEDSVKSYRIVDIGNVIFTKSPIKGYPNGIVRTCKIVDGIVPSLYCVYKKKENISIPIDTRFIQSYLEDKGRLDRYLCPLVNVGARNNVNITDKEFLEGTIKIPTTIEEQAKIVDTLEKISSLINFHQQELDGYKKLKEGLLQQMFC